MCITSTPDRESWGPFQNSAYHMIRQKEFNDQAGEQINCQKKMTSTLEGTHSLEPGGGSKGNGFQSG